MGMKSRMKIAERAEIANMKKSIERRMKKGKRLTFWQAWFDAGLGVKINRQLVIERHAWKYGFKPSRDKMIISGLKKWRADTNILPAD